MRPAPTCSYPRSDVGASFNRRRDRSRWLAAPPKPAIVGGPRSRPGAI